MFRTFITFYFHNCRAFRVFKYWKNKYWSNILHEKQSQKMAINVHFFYLCCWFFKRGFQSISKVDLACWFFLERIIDSRNKLTSHTFSSIIKTTRSEAFWPPMAHRVQNQSGNPPKTITYWNSSQVWTRHHVIMRLLRPLSQHILFPFNVKPRADMSPTSVAPSLSPHQWHGCY